MNVVILLVPLLCVVAAQTTCECDFTTRAVICKGLSLTDFHKKDSGCEHAFWKIDLSENSLEEFPNDLQQFREVNMSLNSLEQLEAAVNQNVRHLDVSKNNIFEINLGNKFRSLQHLIAANNYLGFLDDFLDGQCNIEHLDVSGNIIKTLDAVTRCAHLSVLDASGNMISQVPKKFAFMTKLQVLDLSKNKIKNIFGLPSTLEILNLDENDIQRVSDSLFRGLASLQALNLSFNGISLLEKGAFATLSSLQSLRLRANNLKFLSIELLKGLKSLRGIDLSFNLVESLPNDTFSDLSVLENIYFSLNKLRSIPTLKFSRNVKSIVMDGQMFTKMDHSALLTMFSGTRDERSIFLCLNNFRGDDPEWSNVLKYFDGECSSALRQEMQTILSAPNRVSHVGRYTLSSSPCPCAIFTKGNWDVYACIADGAEVDGLPWLEAAEMYAGIKEEDGGRLSKLKGDEL